MRPPRLPYFSLYAQDWLMSSSLPGCTPAEEAAYMRLLCRQWLDGSLPPELDQVMELLPRKFTEEDVASVLDRFFPLLSIDGEDRRCNARLERERERALAAYDGRRRGGQASKGNLLRGKRSQTGSDASGSASGSAGERSPGEPGSQLPAQPVGQPESQLPGQPEKMSRLSRASSSASGSAGEITPAQPEPRSRVTRESSRPADSRLRASASTPTTTATAVQRPEDHEPTADRFTGNGLPTEVSAALEPYLRSARFPGSVTSAVAMLLNSDATPHYPAELVARSLVEMQAAGREFNASTLSSWCGRKATGAPSVIPLPSRPDPIGTWRPAAERSQPA